MVFSNAFLVFFGFFAGVVAFFVKILRFDCYFCENPKVLIVFKGNFNVFFCFPKVLFMFLKHIKVSY